MFIKQALKKTMIQKKIRERQLLSIETALQLKNQVESDAEFAKAMLAVSKSIAELYGSTDMVKTQKDFEQALVKAQTLQERMQLFLDMTSENMMSQELPESEDLISDKEIDKMLEDEIAHEEGGITDKDVERGLEEIDKELRGES
jgi:oligoribonuclease NrnB/cAMP/cGMP phosphodiesterase (DHH superfamily)